MKMPGRTYTAPSTTYRYGFNGKEEDDEVKGDGNQQDYGMRIYDPRLGRFFSVDPLTHEYPELTPYQFASNRPIVEVDLDGLEAKDLYREIEPVREQRKIESAFGIVHEETRGEKGVRNFVTAGLGFVVLAPVIAEAPALFITTSSRLFWWAAANPQTASGVAFTIFVAASGYEGPDIPGPSDDFGRIGRKVYNKLIASGINSKDALGQASRNSYNAIINTIDYEIKDIVTMEQKAWKASPSPRGLALADPGS
ncbi:MAG: RHS repeat domain-containing protein [Chitinophagaceae bacterium]